MKVTILGGTGLVGRATVQEALKRNHEVTLLVRCADRVKLSHPRLRVIEGDVLNATHLYNVLQGQDAVIQALGYNGKGNGKPTTFTTDVTRVLVPEMKRAGVNRLIAMSVVGAGNSLDFLPRLFTKLILPCFMKWFVFIIEDKNRMEPLVMESGLAWTLVRSITIKDTAKQGRVRATLDGKGLKFSIAVGDVADFLVEQLTADTFVGKAPVISKA